jgi:hypothetical protein
VDELTIVTFALLTTAPVGSVTLPLMLPVLSVVCASRETQQNSINRLNEAINTNEVLRRGVLSLNIFHHPFEYFCH